MAVAAVTTTTSASAATVKPAATSESTTNASITKKLNDLGTSNADIAKIIEEAAGEKGSEQKMQLVTSLLSQRSNRALAVSQALKDIFDTMKRIISNLA